MSAGALVVVSGPSGVGKTTVVAELLKVPGITRSVSATTRAPRGAEVEGKDYFFMTPEAFEEGAPPGDMEDVIGDGEIIDEPGEPEGNVFQTWDADGDGMVNETEFGASGETDMTVYDTDGDGMISQAEYDAYMAANP